MFCEPRGFVNNHTDFSIFKATILGHYKEHRRAFPWRDVISPYRIVVSEVMLQQTQTDRVLKKFDNFINTFPNFETLANAPFERVLAAWKGLGYNRRALALQKIAQLVVTDFDGCLPTDPALLEKFPHIGPATARSILVFAYNKPYAFIETNIRTVFIYFFFKNRTDVKDSEIKPLVEQTLDQDNPREWYYALMDYGVLLKKTVGNLSVRSAVYAKQSRFEGSDRQVRGQVLSLLLERKVVPLYDLPELLHQNRTRTEKVVRTLVMDGFVRYNDEKLLLV